MLEKEQTEEIDQEIERDESVDTSKQVAVQGVIAMRPSVVSVGKEDAGGEETAQTEHEPTVELPAKQITEVQ